MKKKSIIVLFLVLFCLLALFCLTPFIKLFLNWWYHSVVNSEILRDILFSIKRVSIWFAFASLLWIWLAILFGRFKRISIIRYLLEIIRPIPPIARIPLAILRFWLWDSSSYFIVFIWSFFPIFTNTYFWITSIPQIHLDVSHNLQLNRFDLYYKVIWKYILPYIFSGLKIGLWMWWMSLIAAELIGAQSWLGYYIQINRLMLNIWNIILWMFIIGMIWFCLNYWLNKIESSLVKWK